MRILVVDDDSSIRLMLRIIVEKLGRKVVGEAGDGREAIEKSGSLKPELVLLDISMPRLGGFPAARSIHENWPLMGVIFVSQHRDRLYLEEAISCGARGFVVKSCAATELPMALTAFEKGQTYYSQLVA